MIIAKSGRDIPVIYGSGTVNNSGIIKPQPQTQSGGGNLYALAINNSGRPGHQRPMKAPDCSARRGCTVVNSALDARLPRRCGSGFGVAGRVNDNAVVDVRGVTGGGTAHRRRLSGDPKVLNAQKTVVDRNATINVIPFPLETPARSWFGRMTHTQRFRPWKQFCESGVPRWSDLSPARAEPWKFPARAAWLTGRWMPAQRGKAVPSFSTRAISRSSLLGPTIPV